MVPGHLILKNPQLGPHIQLHLVLIAVQVVRGDIGDHRDMRVEAPDPVELETAYLQHIILSGFPHYLQGETVADIARQAHIQPPFPEQVVGEHGRGGLPVASRDGDQGGLREPAAELDLRDHRDARLPHLHEQRHGIGDPGALHAQVGLQQARLRVAPFFPFNASLFKNVPVLFLYRTPVRYKDLIPVFLSQDRSAHAAFPCAEHHQPLAFSLLLLPPARIHAQRIFRVTMVMMASRIPMIQKRVTILLSW